MNLLGAIFQLNPQVVRISEGKAFDAQGNEIQYDVAEAQALVDSYAYIAKRQTEYPSIGDQLDILYHEGYDGWKAQIQAVKDKYPKA